MTGLWSVVRCGSLKVAVGEAAVWAWAWAGTGGAASATGIRITIIPSGSSAILDHVVKGHVQLVGHFQQRVCVCVCVCVCVFELGDWGFRVLATLREREREREVLVVFGFLQREVVRFWLHFRERQLDKCCGPGPDCWLLSLHLFILLRPLCFDTV